MNKSNRGLDSLSDVSYRWLPTKTHLLSSFPQAPLKSNLALFEGNKLKAGQIKLGMLWSGQLSAKATSVGGGEQLSIFGEPSVKASIDWRGYTTPPSKHHFAEEIGVAYKTTPPTKEKEKPLLISNVAKRQAGFAHTWMKPVPELVRPQAKSMLVDQELLCLVALTMIDKVGPKTSRALMQHFGGAEAIFKTSKHQLMRMSSIGEKLAHAIYSKSVLAQAESELNFADKYGIKVLTWYEAAYPLKLKQVDDAPLVLFVKGELSTVDRPHIAIVGTRKPSGQGRRIAAEFASYFAERGITIVSGLAYGIDMEAHTATLQSNGNTIAILGHGLDQIYPRDHATRAREISENGGALVTEFCSGTQPDAYNFPARNRIISGMSDAVLVIEATEKGGALITAKCAFEQDREVFAIPGSPGISTSIGCNRLIRDNVAKIACEPADVLDGLQHLLRFKLEDSGPKSPKMLAQLSDREKIVCQSLTAGLADLDTLGVLTGIVGSELQSILLGLEFRHIVGRAPGNKFRLA